MFLACCIEIQLTDFGDFALQDSGVAVICYETIIWYTTVFSYSPYVVIEYQWPVTYLSWVLLCFFSICWFVFILGAAVASWHSSTCWLRLLVDCLGKKWGQHRSEFCIRSLEDVKQLVNVFSNLVFCIWQKDVEQKSTKQHTQIFYDSLTKLPVSHERSASRTVKNSRSCGYLRRARRLLSEDGEELSGYWYPGCVLTERWTISDMLFMTCYWHVIL